MQLVTSAVREIPREWRSLPRLSIVVSIDGLQPEHDARRTPATYDRILKHIVGHAITVHCTVTRQQVNRPGYLEEFLQFWSAQPEVDEDLVQPLHAADRRDLGRAAARRPIAQRVVADLLALRLRYPKLALPKGLIEVYAEPPDSPDDCIFARTTMTISADLTTKITPCQFGGAPDCANCGCIASAGLAAVARHQLFGFIPVGSIFTGSLKVGEQHAAPAPGRVRPPDAIISGSRGHSHDYHQPESALGCASSCAASSHTAHPLLVQIIPIRRCNIDCGYCNEYDKVSPPVPTERDAAPHRQARRPRHVGRRLQRRRADAAPGSRRPHPPHPRAAA